MTIDRNAASEGARRRVPIALLALAAAAFVTGALFLLVQRPVAAQAPAGIAVWPTISLEPVADGLRLPVYVTHAGDGSGRLFVVEKAGKIIIVENGVKRTTPFLDIVSLVKSTCSECGLLGLAFPPNFATDGYFFVSYTAKSNLAAPVLPGEPSAGNDNALARYRVSASDPNVADSGSGEVILAINQPYQNHNGGEILFGPDDLLYMGVGDGGSGGDPLKSAQNLTSPLGKLLRIEVGATGTYTVPADNPFVKTNPNNPFTAASPVPPQQPTPANDTFLPLVSKPVPTATPLPPTATPVPPTATPVPPTATPVPPTATPSKSAIWAYGLRNPWRFSFDSATGDLWIGDVGQGAWEEVDFVPAGAQGGENYGWSILEGTHCYPPGSSGCVSAGKTQPVYEYDRSVGQSITGGYVYRGSIAALQGIYIYGDFSAGKIFGLRKEGDTWQNTELLDAGFGISSFGEGPAGELYVVDYGGAIKRVAVVN